MKALYAKRWGIETSFRSLKYTVGLIHLHSKIPMPVLQEVFAAFLLFNFTQAVSWGVKISQDSQKRRQRLNFSDAVFARCRFLRRSVKNLEALSQKTPSGSLWQSFSQTFLIWQSYFLLLSLLSMNTTLMAALMYG